ncbi:lytic transglycosylase, catalytic [Burkholderia pseudomallei]|uniref:VgrG-related protein n=1 Tax=Burkholderia pseudomallei TaxID=28450 RepID=UPI00201B2B23|nr:lytic transglycosylase, catalytic [Burkholderia pseudomallei]MCL4670116.1 lytic transglycosylase, catalytic [Burkholderia pseudomallei]
MTIKTDSKGFLIADGAVDTASMAHGIEAVHSDTSAILSLLRGGPHAASVIKRQRVSSPPQAMNAAVQRATSGAVTSAVSSALAQSRARDVQGRFVPNAPSELVGITKAVNAMTRKQVADKAAQKRTEAVATAASVKAVEQARDQSGRFVGRGGSRGEGGGGDSALRNTFSRLKDLFPRRSAPDLGNYEKIDPTVEAAKEVSKIVGGPLAPIGKLTKAGASRAFGIGKEASLPWLRKIFNVLKVSHDSQSEFALTQTRILKEIDNKTGGGRVSAGGGILGSIGGMLTGRSGGLLSSLFSGALSLGKKGLKRLPLLGALFAGGSALASIFGGDDPNKTAEQNRQDRFTGAGSGIGALIGGGVGTLLGGPVGTLIGGVIGDKLGEMVGSWLATVDWSKVGAQISDTWNSAVGTFKDDWKFVTDKFASVTKTIGDTWNALLSGAKAFLKDKFGIDVDAIAQSGKDLANAAGDKAKQVAEPVVNAAKKGIDAAKEAGKAVVDYGKERATKMAEPIVRAGGVVKDWVLGQTSKLFESGKGGAGAVSSGKGDHGGASYGTYQLSSTQGTVQKFLSSSKYGEQFAGLKPGTPEFDAKWKDVAKNDPAFGDAQHDFIKATHYDPALSGLKGAGIDLSGRGAAVQDAIWSSSVQFGAGNAKRGNGAIGIFQKALAGRDVSKLSDEQIVSAVQDYKLANNDRLFANSSAAVRAGTARRANAEKAKLLALAGGYSASGAGVAGGAQPVSALATAIASTMPVAPVVATVAATPVSLMVSVPPVPTAPAVPPAQTAQIPVPLNSDKPLEVRIADDRAVGQDLRNRRLAQIATGGASG